MAKKSSSQQDQVGYREGYRTGLSRGYKKGLIDALEVINFMLEDHGMVVSDSEFSMQIQELINSGELTPPDEK